MLSNIQNETCKIHQIAVFNNLLPYKKLGVIWMLLANFLYSNGKNIDNKIDRIIYTYFTVQATGCF